MKEFCFMLGLNPFKYSSWQVWKIFLMLTYYKEEI